MFKLSSSFPHCETSLGCTRIPTPPGLRRQNIYDQKYGYFEKWDKEKKITFNKQTTAKIRPVCFSLNIFQACLFKKPFFDFFFLTAIIMHFLQTVHWVILHRKCADDHRFLKCVKKE